MNGERVSHVIQTIAEDKSGIGENSEFDFVSTFFYASYTGGVGIKNPLGSLP